MIHLLCLCGVSSPLIKACTVLQLRIPIGLGKATEWGATDAAGHPAGTLCYQCADICGRIRPGLPHKDASDFRKNPSKEDARLPESFQEAEENYNDTPAPRFLPSASVVKEESFSMELYQEFGALSSDEFLAMTGVTVKEAGIDPVKLQWKVPGTTRDYYLVSLKGLAWEDYVSIAKCRINFLEKSVFHEHYLRPQEQLVEDQGAFMLRHVYNMTKRAVLAASKKTPRPNQ